MPLGGVDARGIHAITLIAPDSPLRRIAVSRIIGVSGGSAAWGVVW
jgi:hypothetical protein